MRFEFVAIYRLVPIQQKENKKKGGRGGEKKKMRKEWQSNLRVLDKMLRDVQNYP